MKNESPTLPRRRPSASTPAGPNNILTLPVADVDAELATVRAISSCTVGEAITRARRAYDDAYRNWQLWAARPTDQNALERADYYLSEISLVLQRLENVAGIAVADIGPLPKALKVIEQEEIAPDFVEHLEAPEKPAKRSSEWLAAMGALRIEMAASGLDRKVELPAQRETRIGCVAHWIGRTIESFSDMDIRELHMVTDAIRRGDIGNGWEIVTDAALMPTGRVSTVNHPLEAEDSVYYESLVNYYDECAREANAPMPGEDEAWDFEEAA
jgi:hypothetical protein